MCFFQRVYPLQILRNLIVNINSINRCLQEENKWAKWWPGNIAHDSLTNKDVFEYKEYTYEVTGYKYNAIVIQTEAKNFTIEGTTFFSARKY